MGTDDEDGPLSIAYDLASNTGQFEGDVLAALQMLHAAEGWRGATIPPQCEKRPVDPDMVQLDSPEAVGD